MLAQELRVRDRDPAGAERGASEGRGRFEEGARRLAVAALRIHAGDRQHDPLRRREGGAMQGV
jgi:hypothetical protein